MQHKRGKGRGRSIPAVGPVASRGARAPPAPIALVGALGSAREDLSCHDMCALAAMAGPVTRATMIGVRTDCEGAGGTGDCTGHDAAGDGAPGSSRRACSGGRGHSRAEWGQADVRPRTHAVTGG
jgi:hypothetical protein